jgi:hypothetical protein
VVVVVVDKVHTQVWQELHKLVLQVKDMLEELHLQWDIHIEVVVVVGPVKLVFLITLEAIQVMEVMDYL